MRFALGAVIILLCSCTSVSSPNYEGFPNEEELQSYALEIDTALFRYPFRVRVHDDKAIVMDLHGADHFYHIFQYPDFQYLSSFGKRGQSPEEVLSAVDVRFQNNDIWTLDSNKSELIRLGYSQSGSLLREGMVTLDGSLLSALDFAMYNDSTFIIPDYSGEARFCFVDGKGHLLRKTGVIPIQNKETLKNAAPAVAQAWRSFIDYNPRNGVLAAVTQLGEVLEIYNMKNDTHIIRMGPGGEPVFKMSGGYAIPSGIMGFSDVQVTDYAIYAVFHGRTFKEMAQQKDQMIDGGQYIYVFSLNGEPICKYVLDRYIYGIQVDEENGVIIATDVNSDQPIVTFQLASL